DAVVYAFGAQTDRRLGIPGEDLPGSWSATEFVAWYNGHPVYQELSFALDVERAVVIGNGNVALDVARMLALTPEELAPTDTTEAAIEAISSSRVSDIVVLGRRGPAEAAFTPVELGELAELAGADVLVDPHDLEGVVNEQPDARVRRNLETLHGLDQARPHRNHRHEQEGRDGDGPAAARRRPRRPARARCGQDRRGCRRSPRRARRAPHRLHGLAGDRLARALARRAAGPAAR